VGASGTRVTGYAATLKYHPDDGRSRRLELYPERGNDRIRGANLGRKEARNDGFASSQAHDSQNIFATA
jgi:hypothetical protein